MSKKYIDANGYKKDLIHLGFLPAIVVDLLDKQPAVDVVEVVRCKDCKHCHKETKWNGVKYLGCVRVGFCDITEVDANHYCGYGERRENEG